MAGSRLVVVVLFLGIATSGFFFGPSQLHVAGTNAEPQPTPRKRVSKTPPKRKYSEFPHNEKAHQIDCASCHKFPSENWNKVRQGDEAFPDITDYPKHESCLNCHRQQFFKGTPPTICSICHTTPGPRISSRHPFPNPREIFDLSPKGKRAESDFVVGFPHDKHIDIVSVNSPDRRFVNAAFVREDRLRAAEESCSVCHQTYKPQGNSKDEYLTPPPPKLGDGFWLKKGTFKTTPLGHTTCFTCHSADSGILPAPENCGTCHRLKPPQPRADFDQKLATAMKIEDKRMMDLWLRRDSSGKFQHEFVAHVDASCSTCHNVLKINTADPLTKKVGISSCATCHATPTTDDGGTLNFEVDARKANAAFQCVKCHISFGKLPIPESHTAAIAAAGK
jgi:hypothetical protein